MNTLPFKLRSASLNDYEAINRLYYELDYFQYDPYHFKNPPSLQLQEKVFYAAVEGPNDTSTYFYVAEVQDAIVGVIQFKLDSISGSRFLRDAEWVSIEELIVLPAYRRQGIATALLARIEEWTQAHQISELRLEVFHFKQAANNLYNKAGFIPIVQTMSKRIKLD